MFPYIYITLRVWGFSFLFLSCPYLFLSSLSLTPGDRRPVAGEGAEAAPPPSAALLLLRRWRRGSSSSGAAPPPSARARRWHGPTCSVAARACTLGGSEAWAQVCAVGKAVSGVMAWQKRRGAVQSPREMPLQKRSRVIIFLMFSWIH